MEQSSPSPNTYNIPQKTQIQQNKNYYNTSNSNYNNYDPYYTIYDDEIYGDVGKLLTVSSIMRILVERLFI